MRHRGEILHDPLSVTDAGKEVLRQVKIVRAHKSSGAIDETRMAQNAINYWLRTMKSIYSKDEIRARSGLPKRFLKVLLD